MTVGEIRETPDAVLKFSKLGGRLGCLFAKNVGRAVLRGREVGQIGFRCTVSQRRFSLVKRSSAPLHSAENHLFARRTANMHQFQKRSNHAICKSLGFNIWNNRCVTKKLAV